MLFVWEQRAAVVSGGGEALRGIDKHVACTSARENRSHQSSGGPCRSLHVIRGFDRHLIPINCSGLVLKAFSPAMVILLLKTAGPGGWFSARPTRWLANCASSK